MLRRLWRRAGDGAGQGGDADSGSGSGPQPRTTPRSISQRALSGQSPGCMAAFFGVFLAAGLGFLLFFLLPALEVAKARSWQAVDCEILSSAVESHSSSDGGPTYGIEVRYRYEVDGVAYESDRYEFMGGSSSGYESKRRVVDGIPAGSVTTCYVDPALPSSSVMYRGFTWVYLFALLPLIFVVIGAAGIGWALTSGRRATAPKGLAPALGPGSDAGEEVGRFREVDEWSTPVAASGPVELEESLGPIGKLLLTTAIALFWNGIVSVFVWQVWKGWRAGGGLDGCLVAFLVPFVLVGLFLLTGIPYAILALANPRPKLTLSRAAVPLGGSVQLEWRIRGAARRIERLRIYLEGAEKATYRRGTTTHTDTEVFATIELVDRQRGMPMATGNATIEVPADTMHSFDGGRNEIVWKLKVHGSIRLWPDVQSEFPFIVQPGEGEA